VRINNLEYTCLCADGNRFQTKLIQEHVKSKIKVNDVISYHFKYVSSAGNLIKPEIYKIRKDLTWAHVLANRKVIHRRTTKGQSKIHKWKELKEQRKFFDHFAQLKHFDCLDAEKWYLTKQKEVLKAGGQRVLSIYNGSHIQALIKLYPELNLKQERFRYFAGNPWKSDLSRREFFDAFAKSKNFGPLDAAKWSSINKKQVENAGGTDVLKFYKGSLVTALTQLYHFHAGSLDKASSNIKDKRWRIVARRRKFFDNLAISKKFDPLNAEKWYLISWKEIMSAGGKGILNYYGGSYTKALAGLYPELHLRKENFLFCRDPALKSKKRSK